MASLDQSLKRMHLDYVDLFYSHRFDPETPIEETLQALVDIVRQGKALYVGISNWPLEPLMAAHKYLKERDVPLLIYQGRMSMIDHTHIENGVLDFCRENGVGFIAFSPLGQGLLTSRYLDGMVPEDSRMAKGVFLKRDVLTEEMRSQLLQWNGEAHAKGMELSQYAIDWVAKQPGMTSVLLGASSVKQLEENCKFLH